MASSEGDENTNSQDYDLSEKERLDTSEMEEDEETTTKGGESTEEIESYTTDATSETDIDVTWTSESQDTESARETESEAASNPERPNIIFRDNILNIKGRQIRCEDFEWAKPPVPTLAEMVLEGDQNITESNLEYFLRVAKPDQKLKISASLPLDLPVEVTLPLIEDEEFWRRTCEAELHPTWNIWRTPGCWKALFVQQTVQQMVEAYDPNQADIAEFIEALKPFSAFAKSLKITKLLKVTEAKVSIDLMDEDFDDKLDDIISSPPTAIYLDFEKLLGCLPGIEDLALMLSPLSLDRELYHLTIPDFNAFFKGLKKLNLRKLKVSNRTATNEQITVLLSHLLTSTTLKELDLSYNFIDDSVSDYVGKLLASTCPLEKLILKNNSIGGEGICSIAAALTENETLRLLDVSLNSISDEGAAFLAEVLVTGSSLVDLDISKTQIRSISGESIAKLIRESKYLRSLKMQENRLGEDPGKLIKAAMKGNTSLLNLDVHFCGFSCDDEGSIYQSILRNRKNMTFPSYVNEDNVIASEFLY